ncbi:MAG TPA: VOC family protein [Byssovorax sp.]
MTNQLVPHLYFSGSCEAAFGHYAACGLGAIRSLQRYAGTPTAAKLGPAWEDKVLHAELEGPGLLLFGGDGPDSEPMKGSALLLERDDVDRARALFDALAAGGRVTVPFARLPWGFYGNFTDRFGVQWAVLVRPEAG